MTERKPATGDELREAGLAREEAAPPAPFDRERALELVDEYEDRGIVCFPVATDKRPRFNGWNAYPTKTREYRRKLFEDWKGDFLIAGIPGDDFVVLDVDDVPGFRAALAGAPVELTGPTVETPSGGLQVWSARNGEALDGVEDCGWGEFRARVCFCVLPGGAVADYVKRGRRVRAPYAWAAGTTRIQDCVALPALPREVLALRPAGRAPAEPRTTAGPIVWREGERNLRLASALGRLRREGAETEELWAHGVIFNDARCRPALDPEEVRRTAESIGRYDPAAVPERPEVIAREIVAKGIREILALQIREIPYLLPRVMPRREVTLFAGPAASTKSLTALALSRAVCIGGECLGWSPTEAGGVLLLDRENGSARTCIRARQIGFDGTEPFFVLTDGADAGLYIEAPGFADTMLEIVGRLPVRPVLVVVDSWTRYTLADENAAREVAAAFENLAALCRDGDLAVALIHHVRKGGPMDRSAPADRVRGSSDFLNAVSSALYFSRVEDVVRLEQIKARDGLPIQPVGFRIRPHASIPDRLAFVLEDAPTRAPSKIEQAKAAVLAAVREAPGSTVGDLERRGIAPRTTLWDAVHELETAGKVSVREASKQGGTAKTLYPVCEQ